MYLNQYVVKSFKKNQNFISLFIYLFFYFLEYNAVSGSDSSATSGEDESRSDTHSGSPTPCNSPKLNRKSTPSSALSHVPYTHTVTTLTRPKPGEKFVILKIPISNSFKMLRR